MHLRVSGSFIDKYMQHKAYSQSYSYQSLIVNVIKMNGKFLSLTGRVAQSVGHLTRKSGSWVQYPVWQHTFVSPSAFSRRAVVSYWRKYVHEVLVNCLGGLSLPRKSVVRLTDRPDMTLDVYHGRKTTIQQQLISDSNFMGNLNKCVVMLR